MSATGGTGGSAHGIALPDSREEGIALAIQMLNEAEGGMLDTCSLYADDRAPGSPQRNFVLDYLLAIERTDSAAVREGFASVLSDFIACSAGGLVPDSSAYEAFLDGRPA